MENFWSYQQNSYNCPLSHNGKLLYKKSWISNLQRLNRLPLVTQATPPKMSSVFVDNMQNQKYNLLEGGKRKPLSYKDARCSVKQPSSYTVRSCLCV